MSSSKLLRLLSKFCLTRSPSVELDYLFYGTSLFDFIDFDDLFGFSHRWGYGSPYAEIDFDDF
jgi:hypothetical protein